MQDHNYNKLKKLIKSLGIILFFLFAGASIVNGTVYYVSTTGNDSQTGTSPADGEAWRTIAFAAAQAQAGDIVHIKAGDYGHEHVVIQNSGTAGNPIIFRGYQHTPGDIPVPATINPNGVNTPPTIDSNEMPLINGADRAGNGINLDSKNYVEIRNIQITLYRYGVFVSNSTYITLNNILITNLGNVGYDGWGIYLQTCRYSNIKNCSVTDARAVNFQIWKSNNIIVENCTAYGVETDNAVDYYIITGYSHDITIRNCLSHNRHPTVAIHPGHGIGIKDTYYNGYSGEHSYNNKIINCVARGHGENFVIAHYAYDNEIMNCTAYGDNIYTQYNSAYRLRDGAHHNMLSNCRAVKTGYGVCFDDTTESPDITTMKDNTFQNCIFEDPVLVYIYYGSTENNVFRNCVFAGPQCLFAVRNINQGNIIKNCIMSNLDAYRLNWHSGDKVPDPDSSDDLFISYSNFWNNDFTKPPGTGNLEADPFYADAANGDYHLKSQYGRWNGSAWIYDSVTSPCIDNGDPASDYSNEPAANGDRINIGAYGGTTQASKSMFTIASTPTETTIVPSPEETTTLAPVAGKVMVSPNPYIKPDNLSESIAFCNLPREADIFIYTVSGKLLESISHQAADDGGCEEWDISNFASGVYIYEVKTLAGKQRGKVSIVK